MKRAKLGMVGYCALAVTTVVVLGSPSNEAVRAEMWQNLQKDTATLSTSIGSLVR